MMSTSQAVPASPGPEPQSHTVPQRETSSIDDYTLPKAVVIRLAKSVLPENTMIQKEAVAALVKSATVFVNYLAATANDVTQQKGKKTINNEEILSALEITEFDMMIPMLKEHIKQFDVARQEKRKKVEEGGEASKKKRKVEEIEDEISVEANGDDEEEDDDEETELEKGSEDAENGDERNEEDDEDGEDEEDNADTESEDHDGEGQSLEIAMEEDEDQTEDEDEDEDVDEALAEDSD